MKWETAPFKPYIVMLILLDSNTHWSEFTLHFWEPVIPTITPEIPTNTTNVNHDKSWPLRVSSKLTEQNEGKCTNLLVYSS